MKALSALALLLAACSSLPAPSAAPPAAGDRQLHLYYGERELDDDFEPADEPTAIGAGFSWAPENGALGGEFGGYLGEDDGRIGSADVDVETTELFAGIRQSWGAEALRPFVSGGVAWIDTEVSADAGPFSGKESDDAVGLYLHAGFDAWIAPNVALGIGYRLVTGADLNLGGEDVDGDYSQVTLAVGFSF